MASEISMTLNNKIIGNLIFRILRVLSVFTMGPFVFRKSCL